MKSYMRLSGMILILVASSFFACNPDEDTPVPEPSGLFFSAVVGVNNKSLTIGTNGYISENKDSCFTDATGDHFNSSIRFYQASTGYYISSREMIRVELRNVLDSIGLNKDSLFQAYLSGSSAPVFTYSAGDTATTDGISFWWRDSDGKWWKTDDGPQAGSVTITETIDITSGGGTSGRRIFIDFECTLYKEGTNESMQITKGKGRFDLYNTCFY